MQGTYYNSKNRNIYTYDDHLSLRKSKDEIRF